MAALDLKAVARLLGIWSPKTSQLILGGAGAAAWLVALVLALLSEGEAVATVFVAVGAPLIAAAAFYARVRKITKDGVELDPGVFGELLVNLPQPAEGVTALEERRSVIEAVEAITVPPIPVDDDLDYLLPPVDRGVQSYERAMQLEAAAQAWLAQEGYDVEPPAAERGVDFIVRRDGGVYAVEVKSSRRGVGGPTPESLRAYFLQARVWVDANLGQGEPFYRLLITDVVPPANLLDRYRKQGIGVVRIDPEHDDVGWVLQPRNSRN